MDGESDFFLLPTHSTAFRHNREECNLRFADGTTRLLKSRYLRPSSPPLQISTLDAMIKVTALSTNHPNKIIQECPAKLRPILDSLTHRFTLTRLIFVHEIPSSEHMRACNSNFKILVAPIGHDLTKRT